ncbi:MAG: hypothetical protein JWO36_3546 [Myxococcales bacterium]|nr:hypothetical protein [Myxococcales bacterium]
MSNYIVLFAITFGILFVATPSQSDVAPSNSPSALPPSTEAVAEPTIATPAVPAPGSETQPKDPFAPYDVGDPNAIWKYTDLTPDERAIANKGHAAAIGETVHAAYNSAVAERAHQAAADSAAAQLGVSGLAGTGVVP